MHDITEQKDHDKLKASLMRSGLAHQMHVGYPRSAHVASRRYLEEISRSRSQTQENTNATWHWDAGHRPFQGSQTCTGTRGDQVVHAIGGDYKKNKR
jgi:hypothetical protein